MRALPALRRVLAPRIRRVGDDGLLLEVEDVAAVHGISAWLNEHSLRESLIEVIPAARTVFVIGDSAALDRLAAEAASVELPDRPVRSPRTHVVEVRYDGADLGDVAERTGLSVAEIVSLHTEALYTVDFFGFAPGHAYLSGVPEALRVPRRASPRTQVPAGAVAVANEYTAIYPAVSPGGWNLIGSNAGEGLWDSTASPPNRVSIGDHVIFRIAT